MATERNHTIGAARLIPNQQSISNAVDEFSGNGSGSIDSERAVAEAGSFDRNEVDERVTEEIEGFLDLALGELAALRTQSEAAAIKQAAELIMEREAIGGRVHVTGVGKSEYVARYAASSLSSTGTPAYFLHATECVHGSAGQVLKSDVVIAISNSGDTRELMYAVATLKEIGIKIIGVSGNSTSALGLASDVFLYSGVENEGGRLNLAPRASILAKHMVLCALSVALEARKGVTREQYARWHPGGVIGKLARGD